MIHNLTFNSLRFIQAALNLNINFYPSNAFIFGSKRVQNELQPYSIIVIFISRNTAKNCLSRALKYEESNVSVSLQINAWKLPSQIYSEVNNVYENK